MICRGVSKQARIKDKGVIYKAVCLGLAHGRMNGAPNENRTHS